MNKLRLIIIAVIIGVVIFAAQCLYTVKPYQDVVQLRFGRMVKPYKVFSKYNLYLKWPSFIDRHISIDTRLQVTDAVMETINTSGRQDMNFQVSAACSGFWQVEDPNKFYTSVLSAIEESESEAGSSFGQKVNDKIRDTIRSSVNNVFGEVPLSELFSLPLFTGTVTRDCLAIDGNTLLPRGLTIRGGKVRNTSEVEKARIGVDGGYLRLDSSHPQPVNCVVIILYGYDRESVGTAASRAVEQMDSYRWVLKTDPAGPQGLDRKEITLTIPLKYLSYDPPKDMVQIDRIQKDITEQVNKQTYADYGVKMVQVEIRRLGIPANALDKIYEKMKSERERISGEFLSSGQKEADIIVSRARAEASGFIAKAQGKARAIKGAADARGAEIAARVQTRDPEFYNWLQSLETAAEILKNKAWVILSTDQPVIDALLGQTLPTAKEPKAEDSQSK